MLWKLHTCARCSVRYLYLFITCTLWGSKINWWYDCFLLLPMLITVAINKPWKKWKKENGSGLPITIPSPGILSPLKWSTGHILMSSVIYYWTNAWQHGIYFSSWPFSVCRARWRIMNLCFKHTSMLFCNQFSGGPHMKRTRVLIGNFERTPKGYRDPALRAWLEMCFTPLRYQFQNNTLQCISCHIFSGSIP